PYTTLFRSGRFVRGSRAALRRDELRRSGLADDVVAVNACGNARAMRRVDHLPHAVANRLELLRIDLHFRLRRGWRHGLPPGPVVDLLQQVRRDAGAAV